MAPYDTDKVPVSYDKGPVVSTLFFFFFFLVNGIFSANKFIINNNNTYKMWYKPLFY